jgi:hypothetical protein
MQWYAYHELDHKQAQRIKPFINDFDSPDERNQKSEKGDDVRSDPDL